MIAGPLGGARVGLSLFGHLGVGGRVEIHHRVTKRQQDAKLEFCPGKFLVRQFLLVHGENTGAFHFGSVVIDGAVVHFDLDVSRLFLAA